MFPEEVHLSRESEDLIRRMVTSAEHRIGSGPPGAADIKRHPFFAGVDWETIRNIEAPFIPHLKSTFDTVCSVFFESACLDTEAHILMCSHISQQT